VIQLGGVDACPLGEVANGAHEVEPARRVATIQIGRPERWLAAVHKEPAWRGTVRDDPLSTDAEHAVGRLFVRRDPATRIPAPPEFRECGIEPFGQSREHDVRVEVDDSRLCVGLAHQKPSRARKSSMAIAAISD
jgi:hypothetical protein